MKRKAISKHRERFSPRTPKSFPGFWVQPVIFLRYEHETYSDWEPGVAIGTLDTTSTTLPTIVDSNLDVVRKGVKFRYVPGGTFWETTPKQTSSQKQIDEVKKARDKTPDSEGDSGFYELATYLIKGRR